MHKIPTGIIGFDLISDGGMPQDRVSLVCGTAGSAKTVLAGQFLAEGIRQFDEPGVFVTFEETPADLRRNFAAFGWDIETWEKQGKWQFIDFSSNPEDIAVISGDYDLTAILLLIQHSIREIGARRISLDSLGALFAQFEDEGIVRREMIRIVLAMKQHGVTGILTAERNNEYGDLSRFGVEEFAADNAIILRNVLEEGKRRRTIEILKYRGTTHHKGEYPFVVLDGQGMQVIPLSAIQLDQASTDQRITSGMPELDDMCGSGLFRNSIVLVSGATGAGKTLLSTHFIKGGVENGERCLLFAFEESRQQLIRNATGWGVDFVGMEKQGLLEVICVYPETQTLEDHYVRIKQAIEKFKPQRIAIDSISALDRMATPKSFREFVLGLTCHLKSIEVAGLFTSTSPALLGALGGNVTEEHVSTLTDTIILLRYMEILGEVRRAIAVLKMRGSSHDRRIREFTIDGSGMHIQEPLTQITGILTGQMKYEAVDGRN